MVRLGGWLFPRRTWIPVPLALALLLVRAGSESASPLRAAAGCLLVAAGEGLRLWGVHHVGVISRTRSDRLGPLVSTGPFGLVRNPLYLGNIALWTGFALSAQLPSMALLFIALLGLEYHAIVRWEEQLLESRLGDRYRAYTARVSRWLPWPRGGNPGAAPAVPHSWRDTFFSERGTLIAIAVGYGLLYLKLKVRP